MCYANYVCESGGQNDLSPVHLKSDHFAKGEMKTLLACFSVAIFALPVTSQQCSGSSTQYGVALIGHEYRSFFADRLATCYTACNTEPACQSLNYNLADNTCYFNSERIFSHPDHEKELDSFVYGDNPQRALIGSIRQRPGFSCKHILLSGDHTGDGEYWLDPESNGNSFTAFCDMTTDGGGWLLVANFVLESSVAPSDWTAETTYQGITNYQNNRMGITTSAMNQLRTHLSFTQIRFHCSKQKGYTFHITTASNSTGEAVVKYFSGQTDARPQACKSFIRLEGDNSRLVRRCDDWAYIGKWGHNTDKGERRMYDHAAYVALLYHWNIDDGSRICDDKSISLSSGDFWKIYVR